MENENNHLISIIIPVYNAEKFLKDTVNTVLNQTYTNWELILVNDCSKDNSKQIAEKYLNDNRIKWIDMEQNSGAALTRNRGIEESKGDFLCFLDADDLWDKDKLEKQLKFMQEKNCAFSFTSYEFADENGVPNGKKVIAKNILKYRECLKNNIISTITVMFNLQLINKELIKMPNLDYVEDTATWWKILRNGYDAYGIPDIYSYYRRLKTSNSVNKFKTQKYLWVLYRKEEKLSILKTLFYLVCKNFNAILRRI